MAWSAVGSSSLVVDCALTLFAAIVWQLMRAYTLAMLQKLSKSDKPIEEQAILDWVNTTVSSSQFAMSCTFVG